MAKKLHILEWSHRLNSKPGTMWQVFLYYNPEYGPGREYTGDLGRIYKRVDGKYTNNVDSKVFSTKESAANHLEELHDTKMRALVRKGGNWDTKTHPKRTLKSEKTIRERSHLSRDESAKTKTGREVRYKLERK
jgi:hypothetical protein